MEKLVGGIMLNIEEDRATITLGDDLTTETIESTNRWLENKFPVQIIKNLCAVLINLSQARIFTAEDAEKFWGMVFLRITSFKPSLKIELILPEDKESASFLQTTTPMEMKVSFVNMDTGWIFNYCKCGADGKPTTEEGDLVNCERCGGLIGV